MDEQLKELFPIEKSLQKLESLDKHYYPLENYNKRKERFKYKSFCLSNNYLDIINNIHNNIYKFQLRELCTLPFSDYIIKKIGLTGVVESIRLRDSYRKKYIRLKDKIDSIFLNDNLFFLTFTFNEIYNNKLKDSNKRIYVVRWLKKYCNDYVGNVDFGEQFGRIHFHCVVSSKEKKIIGNSWKYGALNFKRITRKDTKCIAQYVDKLCNHALKESCKSNYLIYPKKVR